MDVNADGFVTVSSGQPDILPQPVDADTPPAVNPPAPDDKPGATVNEPEPRKDETPAWMKAEITKERNRRRAAEEERARLAEQVDRLTRAIGEKPREEPKSSDKPARPRASDFFTPEEHEAAMDAYEGELTEWQLEQAEKRVEARLAKSGQEQAKARQVETLQSAWSKQVEAAKKEFPDFEELVYSDDFQCSPTMMNAIVEDEQGGKVAYHLATNPDEASRIAALSPIRQIREIGRLSDKLTAPAPGTKAPPPIKPLGGTAPAVAKEPAEESEAEYFARRSAEAKARHERLY